MFIRCRFNLFSMLFILLILSGCSSKISVDLLSKLIGSGNEDSTSSSSEFVEYKRTVTKNNDPTVSITTVDSSYTTRKIDLGINAEKIKTIAYSENFWVFKAYTEQEIKEGKYRTYYLNLNDANPTPVNFIGQTDLPCVTQHARDPWMVIIRGYLYCANTTGSRLTRINLSNYSDKTVFNTVTLDLYYAETDLPLAWTHFFVGSDLYLRVGVWGNIGYVRINGNSVTASWIKNGDDSVGIRWLNNQLVNVSGDGEVTIYTGTSTSEIVTLPGYDRSSNNVPFSRYRFLIDKDIYYFMCSPDSYAGTLGLYKTNLDDIRNATTEYYDFGTIRCDEFSNFQGFNLNGSLYFKAYDTVEKKVNLYRFRPNESEKFQKIVELADLEFDTFFAYNFKPVEYSFYSDSENLCFSGKSGNTYVPYCIDQNHNLNRMGQVSADDPFLAPIKFKKYGNDLLYLAKADRVRLYKADLTSHVSSEVTSVNSLLNLDFAWEHAYANFTGTKSDTVLTGENSLLGIVTFTDKDVDVTIKDIKGNEYKHAFTRVNNSKIYNLYAYKNKTLFAYGQNDYYDLVIFEQDKERKIPLARRILNGDGTLITKYHDRYFYYLNVNYELMRIDMVTENVVLVDTSVLEFEIVEGKVIYIKDEPGAVHVVDKNLTKTLATNKLSDFGIKTTFTDYVTVFRNNVYVAEMDTNTWEPHSYLVGENGVKTEIKDTQGNRMFTELVVYGVASVNDRYVYFVTYDENGDEIMHLFDNQTASTLASYLMSNYNFFLPNMIPNKNDASKMIVEVDTSSAPFVAKFSEYIDGSFEEHLYNLPAIIDDISISLENAKVITVKDKILLAIQRSDVDRVYLLKRAPESPELIFENRHDTIINAVSNSLSIDLESTFYFFSETKDQAVIHYSKLINGNLGSVYAEFDSNTDRFIEKSIVAKEGMDIRSEIFLNEKKLYPDEVDQQFFIGRGIVLDPNKKYSVFKYFKNTNYSYRVTEFMNFDKVIFDLDVEVIPN